MILLHLYWHQEADDLDVGYAYLDFLPPVGATIVCSTTETPHAVWRVVGLHFIPAMEGSKTVRMVQEGRPAPDGQVGMVAVFVEPTEGPFHTEEVSPE